MTYDQLFTEFAKEVVARGGELPMRMRQTKTDRWYEPERWFARASLPCPMLVDGRWRKWGVVEFLPSAVMSIRGDLNWLLVAHGVDSIVRRVRR